MVSQLKPAILILFFMTIITGLIYPLTVTGIAQLVFPNQANGIGQPFDDPKYFWGRPSATAPYPYNAAASSGSNLGPTNPALVDEVKARVQALHDADSGNTAPIPVDLATSSGSGLDPNISIAAALYQVPRVARARGLSEDTVRSRVEQFIEDRQFGILGEPRVNVVRLNLALDAK